MRSVLAVVLAALVGGVAGCGGKACQQLRKYYCEEKKDEKLCKMYEEKIEKGMSNEDCEATLRMAK